MTMTPVRDNGLVAELYTPKDKRHTGAILTLGACTAGNARGTAQGLALEGYVTLALFYCGDPAPARQLADVPLEYMKSAIDWLRASVLAANPNARIAVLGVSQGGQAALITAATYPDVTAVVAIAPSSIVTQALGPLPDPIKNAPLASSWSLGGKPVPYVPHLVQDNWNKHPAAEFPVERINGPVLLISGAASTAWPETEMSDFVVARLKAHNFPFMYEHLRYENAGHGLFAAHDPNDTQFAETYRKVLEKAAAATGGTPEGNVKAQADAWRRVLEFLTASIA
jgi:dienelactone hydrolase